MAHYSLYSDTILRGLRLLFEVPVDLSSNGDFYYKAVF